MAAKDETREFTEQEFQFIFAQCSRLTNKDVAQLLGITEEVVQTTMMSVYDKAGLSGRLDVFVFARAALNAELRRRRLSMGDSGAAMGGL